MHVSEDDVRPSSATYSNNIDMGNREGIKPHNIIVKLVAMYVATSLVVMEVLYFDEHGRTMLSSYTSLDSKCNSQYQFRSHDVIYTNAIGSQSKTPNIEVRSLLY